MGVDRRLGRMDCGNWVYRCELRDNEVRVEERETHVLIQSRAAPHGTGFLNTQNFRFGN